MIAVLNNTQACSRAIVALFSLAAVCCLIWLIANWIVAGELRSVMLLGIAVVAFGIAGKILGNWQTGIYFFLTWLLFEDMIRKYMGNNMAIYFAKDILIAITYLSLWKSGGGRANANLRNPFGFTLALFFLLGLVQVFNPNSPSLFYGVLGLKLYFYYAPLIFVGYALMRAEEDLHRFLVANMVLAGVVALIGVLQSVIGLDFLNPRGASEIDELSHLVRQTPSGVSVPRPCSVFVSDGRFSSYLLLIFIVGMGAGAYLLLRKQQGRKLVFPAVALVAIAIVMTGSRGAFSWMVISSCLLSAGFLWGAPRREGGTYRLFKALRRGLVMIAVAAALMIAIFPQEIGARWTFYRETVLPDSPNSEIYSRAWDYPVQNFLGAWFDPNWLIGHGIGTASLGMQYVTRILHVPSPNIGVESGYGVLILEFGIAGFVLWLAWTCCLLLAAGKLLLKLRGTWAFPVALSISWYAFLLLFPFTYGGLQSYQNFVLNAYFWLLIGVLFRLPALVENSRLAELELLHGV